jgi:hypothetical protein
MTSLKNINDNRVRTGQLMKMKIIFLLGFSGLAAAPYGIRAQAPVPVVNEPFHKVIFSNEFIRIIEVHIQPGDTTLYHIHKTNSAIVFLSTNKTGSQRLGGLPVSGQAERGNTNYANFGDSPITHRVWNAGTGVYHVLDIELANGSPVAPGTLLRNPGLNLVWEKKLARAYKIHLDPGQDFEIKGSPHPHLLIRISGSASPFREGGGPSSGKHPVDFVWYSAGTGLEFKNKGGVTQCILLELN